MDNEQAELMWSAKPYPDSIGKINEWFDQGNYICFFTARTEENRQVTLKWLKEHGVRYHNIIFGKPRRREGDEYHYIDDTPIRATRYKGVFGDLVRKSKEVLVFDDD